MAEAPLRIAIVIPTRNEVDYEFANSLARMCAVSNENLKDIADLELFWENGSMIDLTRRRLVQKTAPWGPTHLLWLDTDMVFPFDTMLRLLAANKDIVGCNYTTRRTPCQPTAYKSFGSAVLKVPGERLYTNEDSSGLEQAVSIGMGVVLMRTQVLAKIGPPGFLSTYDQETGVSTSEDIYFCKRAAECGFQIWVDHDLSKEVGHAGRLVLNSYHAEATRPHLIESVPAVIAPEA